MCTLFVLTLCWAHGSIFNQESSKHCNPWNLRNTRKEVSSPQIMLPNKVIYNHPVPVYNSKDICIILPIILSMFTIVPLLSLLIVYISYDVKFVASSQNLTTFTKSKFSPKTNRSNILCLYPSIILIQILVYENPLSPIYFLLFSDYSFPAIHFRFRGIPRSIYQMSVLILSAIIFSSSTNQQNHFLCIFIFQLSCNAIKGNHTPTWLTFLLVILSNDVHLNPGPSNDQQNYLNFMTWNINSLVKDDFNRVNLIEANNSIYNYDLIAVNETCINDTVEIPDVLLENYTFINSNSTSNSRRGGVGLFYRSNLPIKVRSDLSFPECIVVELKVKRKSLFYTTLYRSPAYNHNSSEFNLFLENFKNLYNKIHVEKPLAMFFSGDFNAHSISWWSDGKNNPEGKKLEELFTTLGLHQLIHEPTNIEPKKTHLVLTLL